MESAVFSEAIIPIGSEPETSARLIFRMSLHSRSLRTKRPGAG